MRIHRVPLSFFHFELAVPVDPDTAVMVRPSIEHRCRNHCVGFGDLGSIVDAGIEHTFSVAVSRHAFEFAVTHQEHRDSAAAWEELRRFDLPEVPGRSGKPVPILDDARLVVGHLSMYEFPSRFKRRYANSWAVLTDAIDGDTAVLGVIADEVDERSFDFEGALLDGSLFVPKLLSVHPAFTGQRMGVRLLAHGLWLLSRSMHDVALFLANPMPGLFRDDEPDRSAEQIERLVRYYESAGFRRWDSEAPIEDDTAVAMYALFGAFTLNFEGWE